MKVYGMEMSKMKNQSNQSQVFASAYYFGFTEILSHRPQDFVFEI